MVKPRSGSRIAHSYLVRHCKVPSGERRRGYRKGQSRGTERRWLWPSCRQAGGALAAQGSRGEVRRADGGKGVTVSPVCHAGPRHVSPTRNTMPGGRSSYSCRTASLPRFRLRLLSLGIGCGGGDRTHDLRRMKPPSCLCSTHAVKHYAASEGDEAVRGTKLASTNAAIGSSSPFSRASSMSRS